MFHPDRGFQEFLRILVSLEGCLGMSRKTTKTGKFSQELSPWIVVVGPNPPDSRPLDPGPNQLLTSNLKLSNLPETLTETKNEPLDIELRDIYDFIYNYSKLRKI